jgi:uncharacterized protein (TIGR03066 family)
MNAARLALVAAMGLGLAGLSFADDKKDDKEADLKKKLIGRWEATKGKGLPAGAILEFKKDGKVVVTFKRDDKERKTEGTYKVKGKSFVLTTKRKGEDHVLTIKVTKITDKALEVEGEEGEALTFKRAKKED